MSEIPTISINLDQRCQECRQKGALPNGLCLRCAAKRLRGQDPPRRRRRTAEVPRRRGLKGQGSLFKGGV